MIEQATRSDQATGPLTIMTELQAERFSRWIAPATDDEYAQLIGPIVYAELVMRNSASNELIDALVELGLDFLGDDDLLAPEV